MATLFRFSVLLLVVTLTPESFCCIHMLDGWQKKPLDELVHSADIVFHGFVLWKHSKDMGRGSGYMAEFGIINVYKGGRKMAEYLRRRWTDRAALDLRGKKVNVTEFGDHRKCQASPENKHSYVVMAEIKDGVMQATYDDVSSAAIEWEPTIDEQVWKIGGWRDWSPWTPCDRTCGKGKQERMRSCAKRRGEGGCEGYNVERRHCNIFPCHGVVNALTIPAYPPNGWIRSPRRPSAWKIAADSHPLIIPSNAFFNRAFPTEFTLLFTLKTEQNSQGMLFVIHTEDTGDIHLALWMSDSLELRYTEDRSVRSQSLSANISDGKWHQLAISFRDDSTVKTFVDCEMKSSLILRRRSLHISEEAQFYIGGMPHLMFKGELEQFLISNNPSVGSKQCSELREPDIEPKSLPAYRPRPATRQNSSSRPRHVDNAHRRTLTVHPQSRINFRNSSSSSRRPQQFRRRNRPTHFPRRHHLTVTFPPHVSRGRQNQNQNRRLIHNQMQSDGGMRRPVLRGRIRRIQLEEAEEDEQGSGGGSISRFTDDNEDEDEYTDESFGDLFDDSKPVHHGGLPGPPPLRVSEPDTMLTAFDDGDVDEEGSGNYEFEWSDWSSCSVTCGDGIQSRTSRCVDNGIGYENCVDAGLETSQSRICILSSCTTTTIKTTSTTASTITTTTSTSTPDPITTSTAIPKSSTTANVSAIPIIATVSEEDTGQLSGSHHLGVSGGHFKETAIDPSATLPNTPEHDYRPHKRRRPSASSGQHPRQPIPTVDNPTITLDKPRASHLNSQRTNATFRKPENVLGGSPDANNTKANDWFQFPGRHDLYPGGQSIDDFNSLKFWKPKRTKKKHPLLQGSHKKKKGGCDNWGTFKKCPPRQSSAKLGDFVIIPCETNRPFELCSWVNPRGVSIRPSPTSPRYRSIGRSKRSCSLKLQRVRLSDQGVWTCNPYFQGKLKHNQVSGRLVITGSVHTPRKPITKHHSGHSCNCENGGVCKGGKCKCWPGYYGSTCSQVQCRLGCQNGGKCVQPNVCQCPEGYSGHRCQYAVCSPPCMYGGRCLRPGVCSCPQGYQADAHCAPQCNMNCLNGGRCVSPSRCSCPPGYSGRRCEQPLCNPRCQQGVCVRPNTCQCPHSRSGPYCQHPVCSPECANGGVCVSQGVCSCPWGTHGKRCEQRSCNPPCVNGGICQKDNTCSCPEGRQGERCQEVSCNLPCENGGRCVAPGYCKCPVGYTGALCQRKKCLSYKIDKVPYERTYKRLVLKDHTTKCGPLKMKVCKRVVPKYETVSKTFYRTVYKCADG